MSNLDNVRSDAILLHGMWNREAESAAWMAERITLFASLASQDDADTRWSVEHQDWSGSRGDLVSIFEDSPYRSEDGSISPKMGYEALHLRCEAPDWTLTYRFSAGCVLVGRNTPLHRVSAIDKRGSSSDIMKACKAALRSFTVAFDPMQVHVTTSDIFDDWKGSNWTIEPGYEVWLNDLVGGIASVPDGISTEQLGNGTLFTLPYDWSSAQVVTAWDELLRANGLSEIDKTLVQPMEIQLPPEDDPGPIPDSVPVTGAPTTEEADPVTAEDYRRQITGWDPTDDGAIPVYSVESGTPAGLSVSYEGHTRRGSEGERYGVFLHSVFGIDHLATDPLSDLSVLTAAELLNIASWQLNALPDGAVLEWHSNTTPGATALRNLLITNGITTIRVRNTPAIGADDE